MSGSGFCFKETLRILFISHLCTHVLDRHYVGKIIFLLHSLGFKKKITLIILITQWVSFWIKPEAAPARVTLGVTSLLTLSTQHAKSQASLPPVSYLKGKFNLFYNANLEVVIFNF